MTSLPYNDSLPYSPFANGRLHMGGSSVQTEALVDPLSTNCPCAQANGGPLQGCSGVQSDPLAHRGIPSPTFDMFSPLAVLTISVLKICQVPAHLPVPARHCHFHKGLLEKLSWSLPIPLFKPSPKSGDLNAESVMLPGLARGAPAASPASLPGMFPAWRSVTSTWSFGMLSNPQLAKSLNN